MTHTQLLRINGGPQSFWERLQHSIWDHMIPSEISCQANVTVLSDNKILYENSVPNDNSIRCASCVPVAEFFLFYFVFQVVVD